MELKKLLSMPVDEDLLDGLGFSQYDDEHCTWGNRRLRFGDKDNWYTLQIIDYGDFPMENGRPEGFSYQGWFEIAERFKTKDGWDLNTLKDIYKIIYLYHREWLDEFKLKCKGLTK